MPHINLTAGGLQASAIVRTLSPDDAGVSIEAARFESRVDKSTGTARANRFSFNRHFHKGRQRPAVRLRRVAGLGPWGVQQAAGFLAGWVEVPGCLRACVAMTNPVGEFFASRSLFTKSPNADSTRVFYPAVRPGDKRLHALVSSWPD
jgi:hypothetical protein